MPGLPKLTLVLGGARSGKSRYAEGLMTALPPPWTYIATAEAGDAEMAARIEGHRKRRGGDWRTIEAPRDLAQALSACGEEPVLVDCLTLWLSNLMLAEADIEAETAQLENTLAAASGPRVLVANEVGSGIVPSTPLGRRFG
jgi:adenosylcobinamide kinase / adenosylcobinamide-phosphate guanylyltransferase